MTKVVIKNAALEERGDHIILRGTCDPQSLRHIRTDDYQREARPVTALGSLIKAYKLGERVPDVELGMRGEKHKWLDDNTVELYDPVYAIDGLQRITAGVQVLALDPSAPVHIGVAVNFNSTKQWERDLFRKLNTLRVGVSPHVILRNMREESKAIETLYALSTNDQNFVLRGRVCWDQKMARGKGEITTALMLAKVVGVLHSHKVAGRSKNMHELVPALDKQVESIGVNVMRDNIRNFFDLIDECWGIKRIQYGETAPQLKGTFLQTLARVLSDHAIFWKAPDEKRLFVEAPLRRKMQLFPIHDTTVSQLAGASGKAGAYLAGLLVDHLNSGKRTKRLISRHGVTLPDSTEDETEAA